MANDNRNVTLAYIAPIVAAILLAVIAWLWQGMAADIRCVSERVRQVELSVARIETRLETILKTDRGIGRNTSQAAADATFEARPISWVGSTDVDDPGRF